MIRFIGCRTDRIFSARYDDCAAVYRDAGTWSSDKKVDFRPNFGESSLYEHHTTSLVFNDPPYHTRVRKLLAPAFTPRALEALRPRIEALVDRLLDRAAAAGGMDLIADFAAAIPLQLVGDMLGVPAGERGTAAGLVARDPGCARAGADRRAVRARHPGGGRVQGLSARSRGPPQARDGPGRGRDPVQADRRQHPHPFPPPRAGEGKGGGLRPTAGRPERARAPAQLHIRSQRRARDHHQSHRQWRRSADPQSRRHGRSARASRADRDARWRNFCAWKARTSSATGVPPGTPCSPASRCRKAPTSTSGSAPPTAMARSFPSRTASTFAAIPTGTSRSATGIHVCAGMSLARMEAQVAIGALVRRFATIERAGEFVRGGRARFRGFLRYPLRLAQSS